MVTLSSLVSASAIAENTASTTPEACALESDASVATWDERSDFFIRGSLGECAGPRRPGWYPKDGWLYADYRVNDDEWTQQEFGDGTRLPSSWEGLSDGAIWQVWRPDPTSDRVEKMLVGVPFYQTRLSTDRSMSIRTHHDLSLLRLLHRARVAPRDAVTESEVVELVNRYGADRAP